MASDINSRLSAILDRNPKLRPQQSGFYSLFYGEHASQGNVRIGWHESGPPEEDGTRSTYATDDAHAHALIFREMVEQLPWPYELGRFDPGADSEWFIMSRTTAEVRAVGDTALDALINFYEGKDTP